MRSGLRRLQRADLRLCLRQRLACVVNVPFQLTNLFFQRVAFAFEVGEIAVDAILGEIEPGMTELQVIGIAQREIYRHGGEYEGHALYCFCGPATNNAISRPTHNTIKENEVIQLNIGARVGGYSSSVGIPFSIGPLPARKQRLVEFGLEAHFKTMELMKAGKPAARPSPTAATLGPSPETAPIAAPPYLGGPREFTVEVDGETFLAPHIVEKYWS